LKGDFLPSENPLPEGRRSLARCASSERMSDHVPKTQKKTKEKKTMMKEEMTTRVTMETMI